MTTTTIDGEVFSALRDTTGGEFVRELIDTFLTEAPGMLSDLREALGNGEADRFRRAAHSLKSNANTFGALNLGNLAKDLELAGVAAVKARGPAALAPIEAEYLRVAADLKTLRDE
jgi:HPt (histidine-containing phosphotransfer) domain-containing protein